MSITSGHVATLVGGGHDRRRAAQGDETERVHARRARRRHPPTLRGVHDMPRLPCAGGRGDGPRVIAGVGDRQGLGPGRNPATIDAQHAEISVDHRRRVDCHRLRLVHAAARDRLRLRTSGADHGRPPATSCVSPCDTAGAGGELVEQRRVPHLADPHQPARAEQRMLGETNGG
jgi:hypothetical protein